MLAPLIENGHVLNSSDVAFVYKRRIKNAHSAAQPYILFGTNFTSMLTQILTCGGASTQCATASNLAVVAYACCGSGGPYGL